MTLEKLANHLGRKDEALNIELAEQLIKQHDTTGIQELIDGLQLSKAVANDCIKVLYEIGARQPELIAPYYQTFLDSLSSRNNRLVWGAMTALAEIASEKPAELFGQIDKVIAVYHNGSVITVDQSITVFAKLCRAGHQYEAALFPLLLKHLETCRAKEVPQHAERMALCIDSDNQQMFKDVLEKRQPDLSAAQAKRIGKLLRSL